MADKDKKSGTTTELPLSDKSDQGTKTSKAKDQKDFPLSLDEFCTRLSQNDKRVELIGGFHASEKAAQNLNDTEANYMKRLDEFAKKPVA